MACNDALIENVISVRPDQTVNEVMELFKEKHFHSVPVVNPDGTLAGLFSLQTVLKCLLPVAAVMENGLESLDFIIGASPGIAKRLRKLQPRTMSEVMERNPVTLYPDTPSWEAIRIMARHGSPIPIVEEKTNQFVGMISSQSMMENLFDILDEVEAEEAGETGKA